VDRDEIERTSEQVRRILEAAEASAEQIRAQAADDVTRLRTRLADVESELSGVVETLRRSGEQLAEALAPPRDEAPAETAAQPDGDEAGARLTALNMALGGTPRDETARYLAEHYALADAEALLDDVYDRAGG
jgi:ABC-type transporter Mla subunit MlaD